MQVACNSTRYLSVQALISMPSRQHREPVALKCRAWSNVCFGKLKAGAFIHRKHANKRAVPSEFSSASRQGSAGRARENDKETHRACLTPLQGTGTNRMEYYLPDELVLIGYRHRTDSMQPEKNSVLGRGRICVGPLFLPQEDRTGTSKSFLWRWTWL